MSGKNTNLAFLATVVAGVDCTVTDNSDTDAAAVADKDKVADATMAKAIANFFIFISYGTVSPLYVN